MNTLDYLSRNSLYQATITSKSSVVALALIHANIITIEEAVRHSRLDEDYQIKHFGMVEGAHDLDEAYMYSVFSVAKTIISLS